MNPKRTGPRASSRRGKRTRGAERLDSLAAETLRLVAKTFLNCGYSPQEVSSRFKWFVENAPPSARAHKHDTRSDILDPGHVITLWLSDPQYVDSEGKPRPIPARGSPPSIEALVKRVRSNLSLEDTLKTLIQASALRKVGTHFIPNGDFVHHPPGSKLQTAHHLLVLYQLLRNFEFNAKPRKGELAWPQRVTECPDFPATELPALITQLDKRVRSFMTSYDQNMALTALKADPSVPRVRPSINLFLSVTNPSRTRMKSR